MTSSEGAESAKQPPHQALWIPIGIVAWIVLFTTLYVAEMVSAALGLYVFGVTNIVWMSGLMAVIAVWIARNDVRGDSHAA